MTTTTAVETGRASSLPHVALASALLGTASVAFAYWMVLPAVVLGAVGVVAGLAARRRSPSGSTARDVALVAICLGAVAILFTPVLFMQTNGAEEWGRDCALNPQQDPHCPRP